MLKTWVLGVTLVATGWPLAWAAESPVPTAENPVRIAQSVPAQPKMIAPDFKALAIAVVPDLRGRSEAEARELLAGSRLQLGKVGRVAAQQAPGTVVRQSPAAKQTVARGSAVDIWLAMAPAIKVPNLIGRPVKEAEAVLEKSGFRLGQVSTVAAGYPEGTVARQYPAANATADRGASVNVWIAAPQPVPPSNLVTVPNLVNRDVRDADAMLANSRLTLGQVTRVPYGADDGIVIRQSPSAGQRVETGARVNVWVAAAEPAPPPNRVKVPDVLRRNVKDAESILLNSGLRLGRVTARPLDAPEGMVLAQTPSPGQSVERGSPVDVAVAEAPGREVPNVVGRPLKEAEAIVAKASLRLRAVGREESDYPEGAVARQSPAPGEVIAMGSEVRVWVTRPIVVTVPELRGFPIAEAEQRLKEGRLRVGARSTRPSLPPEGEVVDQKPPPGTEVKVGTPVDVAVGDGSRTRVPAIVGEIEGAALERLAAAGLRAGERGAEESERPEGEVLRQQPAEGSVVARGSEIAYRVAKALQVDVPRIIGLTVDEAMAQLEPLGLTGSEMGAEESDRPLREILRQDPAPGERVPRGSRVGFWIASPMAVTVPNLAGLQAVEAEERLRVAGLVPGTSQTELSREPEGTVIRQLPPRGERVPRGAPVDYWVASAALVTVPDLSGQRPDVARARLADLGLTMREIAPEQNDAAEGTVIGHDPAAGTPVPVGTEIAVRVSAGRPLGVPNWVIGGGVGAALLAAGGALWLARRPAPSPKPPPSPVKPTVRVRMGEPEALVQDALTLDPKTPAVGVRTRLAPGDSDVSAEKDLVVREERRET
jgi:beta-lactam-binding protein with PASTA domain